MTRTEMSPTFPGSKWRFSIIFLISLEPWSNLLLATSSWQHNEKLRAIWPLQPSKMKRPRRLLGKGPSSINPSAVYTQQSLGWPEQNENFQARKKSFLSSFPSWGESGLSSHFRRRDAAQASGIVLPTSVHYSRVYEYIVIMSRV